MAIGSTRRVSIAREYSGWGATFALLDASQVATDTEVTVIGKGGSAFGTPVAQVGQYVYFCDSKEVPKRITAIGSVVVNADGEDTYALTLASALTLPHTAGDEVGIEWATEKGTLYDTFNANKNYNYWGSEPFNNTRAMTTIRHRGRVEASGSLEYGLRPAVNNSTLARAVGYDSVSGEAHGTPYVGITLGVASTAGALTVTVSDGTSVSANHLIQIGTGTYSEVRNVVSKSTNVLTLDQPLAYDHASAATVQRVKKPGVDALAKITHDIPSSQYDLPSSVIEDYRPYEDTSQSNKLAANSYLITGLLFKSLKVESQSEQGVKINLDWEAQDVMKVGVLANIAAPTETTIYGYEMESLFVGTVIDGTTKRYAVTEASIELDNNLQTVNAKNGSNRPFKKTAGLQSVKGSFKFYSIAELQDLFYTAVEQNTTFSFQWKIKDRRTKDYVQFSIPKISLDEFKDGEFNRADLIYTTVNFVGMLDAGGTNRQLDLKIVNEDWATY